MNDPLRPTNEPQRANDLTSQLLRFAQQDRPRVALSDDLPELRRRVRRRRTLSNIVLIAVVLTVIVGTILTLGNIPRWTDKATALRVDTAKPLTSEDVNCQADLSEILTEPTTIEGFALNDFTVQGDGSLHALLRGPDAISSVPDMELLGGDYFEDESLPWVDADLTSLQGIWYPLSLGVDESVTVDQPVQWLSGYRNQFVQSVSTVDLWTVEGDGSKSFERCVSQSEIDGGYVAPKPPPGTGRYLVVGYLQTEIVRPIEGSRTTEVLYASDTVTVDVTADGTFNVVERPRRSPHVIKHHP
ncbi:hypothetical protein SAMN06309944_1397 [Micrococcales bacterium KH10]|nr:hypothetical protein SAMN06309944_1397 [Micrococcales bacterium KH10]